MLFNGVLLLSLAKSEASRAPFPLTLLFSKPRPHVIISTTFYTINHISVKVYNKQYYIFLPSFVEQLCSSAREIDVH